MIFNEGDSSLTQITLPQDEEMRAATLPTQPPKLDSFPEPLQPDDVEKLLAITKLITGDMALLAKDLVIKSDSVEATQFMGTMRSDPDYKTSLEVISKQHGADESALRERRYLLGVNLNPEQQSRYENLYPQLLADYDKTVALIDGQVPQVIGNRSAERTADIDRVARAFMHNTATTEEILPERKDGLQGLLQRGAESARKRQQEREVKRQEVLLQTSITQLKTKYSSPKANS